MAGCNRFQLAGVALRYLGLDGPSGAKHVRSFLCEALSVLHFENTCLSVGSTGASASGACQCRKGISSNAGAGIVGRAGSRVVQSSLAHRFFRFFPHGGAPL